MEKRRVVITGMGVVAPNGIGIDSFWDSIVRGTSGVRRITHFDASSYPSQIAAEVSDFDPGDYMDFKTQKKLAKFAQFALAASEMAIQDSELNLSQEDPHKAGVYIGTAMGGMDVIQSQHAVFMEKGLKRMSPFAVVSGSTHSASGIIACTFGLKGTNTTISAGCNSGLDAEFLAYNAIRLGDADIMIVGAGEAPITPCTYSSFCAIGLHSRENNDPKRAVRPYDINADGMVLGEGAAVIIMEELQHALARGRKIYGEILGYGSLNEAYDFIEVDESCETMALNLELALKHASLDIREVDYINSHGNGILSYDILETQAIKRVFGELAYNIPVSSIKPVTGHSISATGVWQTMASLLAIKSNIVPPTINVENPDPKCDLNYVSKGFIRKEVQTVLINTHGFGGRLTSLVVAKFLHDKAIS